MTAEASRERPPAPKRNRQATLMSAALKRVFRAHGLRYRDVAQAVGVSEVTVKRWMTGQNLTIDQADLLCEVVGISFAELTELASRDDDARLRQLSRAQEEGLAAEGQGLLAFVFWLLLNGWSPAEIRRECEIEQAALVGYLTRLDRLRLIDLLPGNTVRLLTRREIEWRRDGPMRGLFHTNVKQYFLDMDFRHPSSIWASTTHKLSKSSASRLEQMAEEFKREVRALAEADRTLQGADKSWYVMLMAARPVSIEALKLTGQR